MKIAIIGAGAMGCMLGACLLEGGADVSLIVRRKELAEKYRSSGIRIKSYRPGDLDFGPVPMKAAVSVEGMEVQDAVLFMVYWLHLMAAEGRHSSVTSIFHTD